MHDRNPPSPERIGAIRAQIARLRAGESPKAVFAGLDDLIGALLDMDYHAAMHEVLAAKARSAVMASMDTRLVDLGNHVAEVMRRVEGLRK